MGTWTHGERGWNDAEHRLIWSDGRPTGLDVEGQNGLRFSSDAKGFASKSPGPYKIHTLECSQTQAETGIQSDSTGVSIVGCSTNVEDPTARRILPKPGLYSDPLSAAVSVEAEWQRVGYLDATFEPRNVTVYVRVSMKSVVCGKSEKCVPGSSQAGSETYNTCSEAECLDPFQGASGPLESSCICKGKDKCQQGEMCTATGKCVNACPMNGERTERRCLCGNRDQDFQVTGESWCDPGYACDHSSATCALHVCPNSDGSSAATDPCVCTGSTFSEVCVQGTYCMADALLFIDEDPLTLCQTKCKSDGGSILSSACALNDNFRTNAPFASKSLRDVGLGCEENESTDSGQLCKHILE